jgi:hypothetical protein
MKSQYSRFQRADFKIWLKHLRGCCYLIGMMSILSLEVNSYIVIPAFVANPKDFIEMKFELTTVDTL